MPLPKRVISAALAAGVGVGGGYVAVITRGGERSVGVRDGSGATGALQAARKIISSKEKTSQFFITVIKSCGYD